jgi:hypothetical protein
MDTPEHPMVSAMKNFAEGMVQIQEAAKQSKASRKIEKTMGEFKRGNLHSGSKKGPLVTNRRQAVAIALDQARKKGFKIPKKRA